VAGIPLDGGGERDPGHFTRNTACGIPINPQGHDGYRNKPLWTYDPDMVTCGGCKNNVGLRELQSGWPPVRVLSASFKLEGSPEHTRRVFEFRRVMTMEEAEVVSTFLIEHIPHLLDKPKPEVVQAYKSARSARERAALEAKRAEDLGRPVRGPIPR
jgi:hypothetical protein